MLAHFLLCGGEALFTLSYIESALTAEAELGQTEYEGRRGGRDLVIGDYDGLKAALNYECAKDLPESDIGNAASILRSNPDFVPLLRLRIADVKSQLVTAGQSTSQEVREGLLALTREKP